MSDVADTRGWAGGGIAMQWLCAKSPLFKPPFLLMLPHMHSSLIHIIIPLPPSPPLFCLHLQHSVRDVKTGESKRMWETRHDVTSVAISFDGNLVASALQSNDTRYGDRLHHGISLRSVLSSCPKSCQPHALQHSFTIPVPLIASAQPGLCMRLRCWPQPQVPCTHMCP